jgi:hypothetical protein
MIHPRSDPTGPQSRPAQSRPAQSRPVPLKPAGQPADTGTVSDERKPGYDYFPPPRPASYPGPPTGQPSGPPSGSPGGPHLGPGSVVPRQSSGSGRPPPGRGMPRWLIGLIATGVAVFLLAIVAAVAVPVFLDQRLKAEFQATTVKLPAELNGQKRNTGAQARTVARTFAVEGIGVEDVAVYGPVGPKAVIILALKPPAAMSSTRQEVERADIERSFTAQGTTLALHAEPDPGPLGGWIGCGSTAAGLEVCLATSAGSLITVISAAGTGDPVARLRQARAATVTRS